MVENRPLAGGSSDGVGSPFLGPDPDQVVHRRDPHLAVTDGARPGDLGEHVDDALHLRPVVDHDFDPGGRIVIADNARIFEYEAWVRDSGWEDIDRSWSYASYPPIRVLTATKPRRSASKGTKGSKNSRNPKK